MHRCCLRNILCASQEGNCLQPHFAYFLFPLSTKMFMVAVEWQIRVGREEVLLGVGRSAPATWASPVNLVIPVLRPPDQPDKVSGGHGQHPFPKHSSRRLQWELKMKNHSDRHLGRSRVSILALLSATSVTRSKVLGPWALIYPSHKFTQLAPSFHVRLKIGADGVKCLVPCEAHRKCQVPT